MIKKRKKGFTHAEFPDGRGNPNETQIGRKKPSSRIRRRVEFKFK